MGAMGDGEVLARSLGRINRADPELAVVAASLVVNLGHEDDYTPADPSRDLEAELKGEFAQGFEYPDEPSPSELGDIEVELPGAEDFQRLAEQLIEEERGQHAS